MCLFIYSMGFLSFMYFLENHLNIVKTTAICKMLKKNLTWTFSKYFWQLVFIIHVFAKENKVHIYRYLTALAIRILLPTNYICDVTHLLLKTISGQIRNIWISALANFEKFEAVLKHALAHFSYINLLFELQCLLEMQTK